jgi:hypothetical protein
VDLCVLGIFKVLYKRENKVKGLKREILKIYRDLAAFYKSTMIPMAPWSVVRARFPFTPENFSAPVTLHPEIVIERSSLPEISLQEYVEPEASRPPLREISGRRILPSGSVTVPQYWNQSQCL